MFGIPYTKLFLLVKKKMKALQKNIIIGLLYDVVKKTDYKL